MQGIDRLQEAILQRPGEAMEQVGGAIDSDAAAAGKIADAMANEQNTQAVKNATTQSMGYASNLGYKSSDGVTQDGGFYALKGAAAVAAQPGYAAALKGQMDQATQGMTQDAKDSYTNATAGRVQDEIDRSNQFVMAQQQAAGTQADQARASTASAASVNTYNDPDAIAENDKIIRGSIFSIAQREGWPQEKIDQETQLQLAQSHANVIDTALARGDISTAAKLGNLYVPSMDAVTSVRTQEKLKAPLLDLHAAQQAGQLLGQNTAQPPGGGVAATDLPSEQQAFLNTLAGPESAGKYNVRYNGTAQGATFDPTQGHPQIAVPTSGGLTSDAAGRYQFLSSTYKPIAAKLGLTGFSPADQDHAAMDLASTTYQQSTGRDLGADLKEGGHGTQITQALNKVWPSLPGGSQQGTTQQKFDLGISTMAGTQVAGPGAGGQPTAASVAAMKPPRPDFEGAIGRVPLDPSDPELQQATIAKLNQQKNDYDVGEKTEHDNLALNVVPQTLNALASGAVGTPVPELAIRRAYSQPEADAVMGKIADATTEGNLTNGLKYALPADINAQHDALAAKVTNAQGVNPTAPLSAEDMTTATKQLAMFESAAKRNADALQKDPATYVRQAPNVAPLFAQAAANPTPENIAKAIQQSERVQTQLGAVPQAISTAAIDQNVAKIHAAKVEEVPGIIDSLRQSYGDAFPDVYRDLVQKGHLDPNYQPLFTMSPTGPGRVDYAAALKAKADRGDKFEAGDAAFPGAKGAMETQLTYDTKDLQNSFPGSSGDTAITGTRNAIRTLATFYVTDRGMKPEDAVDAAYGRIIGDQTEVSGTIRAPKTINGQPFGADKVIQAGAGVTDNLKPTDLQSGDGQPTVAQARQGQWRTNADGQGVTLQVQNSSGTWRIVRRADGSPMQMDYRALPTAGPAQPSINPAPMLQ